MKKFFYIHLLHTVLLKLSTDHKEVSAKHHHYKQKPHNLYNELSAGIVLPNLVLHKMLINVRPLFMQQLKTDLMGIFWQKKSNFSAILK